VQNDSMNGLPAFTEFDTRSASTLPTCTQLAVTDLKVNLLSEIIIEQIVGI
jgi:hypothetical protein